VRGFVPKEVVDKVATEKEVKTVEELHSFLEKSGHPVVERWKAKPEMAPPREETREAIREEAKPVVQPEAVLPSAEINLPSLPLAFGGFEFVLENVKISAKKLTIKRTKT